MGKRWVRNSFIYLLVVGAVILVFFTLFPGDRDSPQIPFSQVMAMAKDGKITSIVVDGYNLTITADGQTYSSRKEEGDTLTKLLQEAGGKAAAVEVTVKGTRGLSNVLGLLLNFLPFLFFGGLLLFMMRQVQQHLAPPPIPLSKEPQARRQQLLDALENLKLRLAEGKISEATYQELKRDFEAMLRELESQQ